jgi:hypothetical protein
MTLDLVLRLSPPLQPAMVSPTGRLDGHCWKLR